MNEKIVTEKYTCPMHPEITADKPSSCPKCCMDLVGVNDNKSNIEQNNNK